MQMSLSQKRLFFSFSILSKKDRLKLFAFAALQFALNLLDIAGVAIIGLLISVASNQKALKNSSGFFHSIVTHSGLSHLNFNHLIIALCSLASLILLVKTFSILILLQKLNNFMSYRSAEFSSVMVQKLLSGTIQQLQSNTIHNSLWQLTHGVTRLFFDVIQRSFLMFGDICMIALMITTLYFVNPFVALATVGTFAIMCSLLFILMRKRAVIASQLQWNLQVKSNEEIFQVLSSFRETFVKNRRYFFARKIRATRLELAKTTGLLNFLPSISKYSFETFVTLSAILVTLIVFNFGDPNTAFVALGVFLGASTRIAPAALRLQQNAVDLNASLAGSADMLDLVKELETVEKLGVVSDLIDPNHPGFISDILLKEVSFSYPNSSRPTLNAINLEIESGKIYAIVGPSGAGKSTLVDLILGLLEPTSGIIKISGVSPREAIEYWPGAIGYVPQDIVVVNGTIRENIALGYPDGERTNSLVERAYTLAQLSDLVTGSALGTDFHVGDRGSGISGGQRQRLGIARALYTQPKLLFLDEATSALDGQTEEQIADAIVGIKDLTVITIAHRLSTMQKADSVIYVQEGEILAVGTLAEVRKLIPDFNSHIESMGLKSNEQEWG